MQCGGNIEHALMVLRMAHFEKALQVVVTGVQGPADTGITGGGQLLYHFIFRS